MGGLRAPRGCVAGVVALAVVLSGVAAPLEADGWCQTSDPLTPPGQCVAGVPVAWGISCVGMYLNTRELAPSTGNGQDLGAVLRQYVPEAMEQWAAPDAQGRAPRFRMVLVGEVDAPLDTALDGRNVISVNRRWTPDAYHRPGTVAFTVVTSDHTTGTLLEADVEFNARSDENPLGREFRDGPVMWGVVDAPSVVLHELGHVAGLWHSLTPGAVMEASMDIERQRRSLTADDQLGLRTVYPLGRAEDSPGRGCVPERAVLRPTPRALAVGCAAAETPAEGRAPWLAIALVSVGALRRRRVAADGSLRGHALSVERTPPPSLRGATAAPRDANVSRDPPGRPGLARSRLFLQPTAFNV